MPIISGGGGGGATFTGGTITPTTDPGFAVSVPDTTNDAIAVLASSHGGSLTFGIDSLGDVTAGQVVANPVFGAQGLDAMRAIAGTGNALLVQSAVGKYALLVLDNNSATLLRINNDATIGFYGHAAAAQPAAIADAAGGAVQDAQARTALNSLLAAMRSNGLIAT